MVQPTEQSSEGNGHTIIVNIGDHAIAKSEQHAPAEKNETVSESAGLLKSAIGWLSKKLIKSE